MCRPCVTPVWPEVALIAGLAARALSRRGDAKDLYGPEVSAIASEDLSEDFSRWFSGWQWAPFSW